MIENVEGAEWTVARALPRTSGIEGKDRQWVTDLVPMLKDVTGCDGKIDHLWTTRRGKQVMVFNPMDQGIETEYRDGKAFAVKGWRGIRSGCND